MARLIPYMPERGGGGGGGAADGGVFISAAGQSASVGNITFTNQNGVSFGMAGSVISASVSTQPGTPFAIGAGTQSVSTGTVSFSNSNNVSFTMNGSSQVVASASFPAETPFGVSAGTQSVSTGTLVFSNSNNFTFGMSGSSRVTASYTAPVVSNALQTVGSATGSGTNTSRFAADDHVHAGIGQFQISGNTSNTSNIVFGSLVLAGGNNVTLSQATAAGAATVTISAGGAAVTLKQLFPYAAAQWAQMVAPVTSFQRFIPFTMPEYGEITEARIPFFMSVSSSSNSSHGGTLSAWAGLYTLNVSSLSLASSGSATVAWTNTSSNSMTLLSGYKMATVPVNATMTAGDYWFAYRFETASVNANWYTISEVGGSQLGSQFNGVIGSNVGQSYPGLGIATHTNGANMRASIHLDSVQGGGSSRQQVVPFWIGKVGAVS